ncbi:hypothetical protein [Saccharicrinis aurantiacus]|uniref:hypothetical protein n=1 Tax=Saccharicrinis aurantiacus TaxID=1849719 RepID=UPI0024911A9B|nr:hypothetical protein [Saccharicrinis aurantiacus]
MRMRYCLLGLLLLVIVISSCNQQPELNSDKVLLPEHNVVWADTIIYEVLLTNPDELNEWETTKLQGVNSKKIVDDLFKMVYDGEKKAYNYYTNEELSIKQVEEIERRDDYSRDKLGKLQFTETWNMDIANKKMHKEVLSILLAYELYNDSNELRGYKAAFYLKDF